MSSQSPSYYIILSGVVAALISGLFSLWRDSINDNLQLEREKQQRIWQEKNDDKKWNREKIYDSYRALIQGLTKIIQTQAEMDRNNIGFEELRGKLFNLRVEFLSEFNMIILNHPDKDSKEFKEKTKKVAKEIFEKHAFIVQNTIGEIMKTDSRLNQINE